MTESAADDRGERVKLKLVPLERLVWCNGRRIELADAIPYMDRDLFRRARAGLRVAEREATQERLFRESGLKLKIPLDWTDHYSGELWEAYCSLHVSRYGEFFDAPVAERPLTPDERAYYNGIAERWEAEYQRSSCDTT